MLIAIMTIFETIIGNSRRSDFEPGLRRIIHSTNLRNFYQFAKKHKFFLNFSYNLSIFSWYEKKRTSFYVVGSYDMIAKVTADTIDKLKEVISLKISGIEQIKAMLTLIAM